MRFVTTFVAVALCSMPAWADHHENPLAKMMEKMGGEWQADFQMGPINGKMFMESEWAAGEKAVESEWHAEVNGEKVVSGKGLSFWNPEEKRIESVDVDSEGAISYSHVIKMDDKIMESKVTKVIGGTGVFKSGMTTINDFSKLTSIVKNADGAEVFKMTNIRKVESDDEEEDEEEE